jgi:hypothetical protein
MCNQSQLIIKLPKLLFRVTADIFVQMLMFGWHLLNHV